MATSLNGRPVPHVLKFSPDAQKEWKAFQRSVESMPRKDGVLANLPGWGSKLPGNVARVAALFHCVWHGANVVNDLEIGLPIMSRAIQLGETLIPHALAVFEIAGANENRDIAMKLWRIIDGLRSPNFSARDAWHPLRGTYTRTLDVEGGFAVLIDHNYIAEFEGKGEGKPGRPSRKFRVHPRLVSQ
jgi:hypothetical protein